MQSAQTARGGIPTADPSNSRDNFHQPDGGHAIDRGDHASGKRTCDDTVQRTLNRTSDDGVQRTGDVARGDGGTGSRNRSS